MVGSAEKLPGEEVPARVGCPGELQRDREGRDDQTEDRRRPGEVTPSGLQVGREREERVHRAQQDDAALLGQKRQPHPGGCRVEPHGAFDDRVTSQQVQRHRAPEGHRPIEQNLARNDHVIGHQGQDQRRDQACCAAVQQPAETPSHEHRAQAVRSRGEASEQLRRSELETHREQCLEEQRMRAKGREERLERVDTGDRRPLPGVDRLVAVEAQRVDVPDAQQPPDRHDGGQQHELVLEPRPWGEARELIGSFPADRDDLARERHRAGRFAAMLVWARVARQASLLQAPGQAVGAPGPGIGEAERDVQVARRDRAAADRVLELAQRADSQVGGVAGREVQARAQLVVRQAPVHRQPENRQGVAVERRERTRQRVPAEGDRPHRPGVMTRPAPSRCPRRDRRSPSPRYRRSPAACGTSRGRATAADAPVCPRALG